MSAPETNIDKQVRRHRGPLYGIVLAVALVAALFGVLLLWTSDEGPAPAGADTAGQSSLSDS